MRCSPRKAIQTTRFRRSVKWRAPTSRNWRCRTLVNVYGPDKLNDPTQAEPIVQRMMQIDPTNTENYFALAKIYEDAGNLTRPKPC